MKFLHSLLALVAVMQLVTSAQAFFGPYSYGPYPYAYPYGPYPYYGYGKDAAIATGVAAGASLIGTGIGAAIDRHEERKYNDPYYKSDYRQSRRYGNNY